MTDRIPLDDMTSDQLDALHERLERAEQRAEAMTRAMESTAADALKHSGCHAKLMAQCQRAERAEAVIRRVDQMATAWEERLPEVIRTPAVVAAIRAALEPAQRPAAATGSGAAAGMP